MMLKPYCIQNQVDARTTFHSILSSELHTPTLLQRLRGIRPTASAHKLQEGIAKSSGCSRTRLMLTVVAEMPGRQLSKPPGTVIERAYHFQGGSFLRSKHISSAVLSTKRIAYIGSYGELNVVQRFHFIIGIGSDDTGDIRIRLYFHS